MCEIRDYLVKNAKENSDIVSNIIKNALGVYLIPILFGIIGIYTSFSNTTNVKEEIVKIIYIIFIIIAIFTVILIVSITHVLKEEPITESYTNKRIIKLLTNYIININRSNKCRIKSRKHKNIKKLKKC